MANKPFAIQGADLTLGGVNLQAGATGVVIPGVTQATSYIPEEIEDFGDQTLAFQTPPVVIDHTFYSILNEDYNPSGYTEAEYVVDELDDDGYIDNISIVSEGSGWNLASANGAKNNNMWAYIGLAENPFASFASGDWVQIPFRVKIRAGEVETIGGGGSGNELVNGDKSITLNEDGGLTFPDGSVQSTAYTGDGGTVTTKLWVAAGYSPGGSAVVTSTNGVNWTASTLGGFANSEITKVAVADGKIVYIIASGGNTGLYYTTDPADQAIVATGTSTFGPDNWTTDWRELNYLGGKFVAVGSYIVPSTVTTTITSVTPNDSRNALITLSNHDYNYDGTSITISGATNPELNGTFFLRFNATEDTVKTGVYELWDELNETPAIITSSDITGATVADLANALCNYPVYGYSTDGIAWTLVGVSSMWGSTYIPLTPQIKLSDVAYDSTGYLITMIDTMFEEFQGPNDIGIGSWYTTDLSYELDGDNEFTTYIPGYGVGGLPGNFNNIAAYGDGVFFVSDDRRRVWTADAGIGGAWTANDIDYTLQQAYGYAVDGTGLLSGPPVEIIEAVAGTVNGNQLWLATLTNGAVVWTTNLGDTFQTKIVAPFTVELPLHTQGYNTLIDFSGAQYGPQGIWEKITIAVNGNDDTSWNGTYYIAPDQGTGTWQLYDGIEGAAIDSSSWDYPSNPFTITLSQGSLVSAVHIADDVCTVYVNNFNSISKIYRSTDLVTWTQVFSNSDYYIQDIYYSTQTNVVGNKLTNGDFTVTLDADGNLHAPGNIVVGVNNPNQGESHFQIDAADYNTSIQWKNFDSPQDPSETPFECQAQLLRVFATENTITNECDINNPREELVALTVVRPNDPTNKNGLMISTSVGKIPDAPYNDGKGTRNNWIFGGDGKLTFPDDTKQTTAYNLQQQLDKNDAENTLNVTADLKLTQEIFGLIATPLGNYSYDTIIHATCGDFSGNMYAIGTAQQSIFPGNYQYFVVAFDASGNELWWKRFGNDATRGSEIRPTNIEFDNFNNRLLVGYAHVDSEFTGIVDIDPANGNIIMSTDIDTSTASNIRQFDIAYNGTDRYIVGQVDGELATYSAVQAQAGTALNVLVVNWADVGSPENVYPSDYNNWQLDIAGGYTSPSELNTFYNKNLTSITGSGYSATYNISYARTNKRWEYVGYSSTNTGSDYTQGDYVRIAGSDLGGVDSTRIVVTSSDYTRSVQGNNTVYTFTTANITNMNLLNKANFEIWGYWGGDQNSGWHTVLSDMSTWTVTTNGPDTILTAVDDPYFDLGGTILFVDTVNGNDFIAQWGNGGDLFNYNNRGASATSKMRFKMNQSVEFRGPENTNTYTVGTGANTFTLGDYKLYGNGDYTYLVVNNPSVDPADTQGKLQGLESITIDTVELGSLTFHIAGGYSLIGTLGGYGWWLDNNVMGTGGSYDITQMIVPNGTWSTPFATWDIQERLGQQAFIKKFNDWTVTLGEGGSQSTQAITVVNSDVLAAIRWYDSDDKVLVVALDSADGSLKWKRWAGTTDNPGGFPGSIVSDGSYAYVSSTDGNGDGLLTKYDLNNSGALIWQVKHQGDDPFANRPVAAMAQDGNVIVCGSYYENDYENDRVVAFWKISANDGSVMYKTMLVDRGTDRSFREYYDDDCQQFSTMNGNMYWGGYIDDDENEYYIGVAVKLPDNGTGFGRYGRWEYKANEDGYDWVINTSKANGETPTVSLVNQLTLNTNAGDITYWNPADMSDSSNGSTTMYCRPIGNTKPKIMFSDGSEIQQPGIARYSVDHGDNSIYLDYEHNGKFIYFNDNPDGYNTSVYLPINSEIALPIGYTVTLVIGDFNYSIVYVEANGGNSDIEILASGNDSYGTNWWALGNSGPNNTPGIYTLIKIDTNRWMVAGPDIWKD